MRNCVQSADPLSLGSPSVEDLQAVARRQGLHLSDEALVEYRQLMEPILASYRRLDELDEPALPSPYSRGAGWRPAEDENPLNAWYWRVEIKGASSGPLSGRAIAIKDNVAVAGIPMMNGSALLEGFVPKSDATVVTRILDAGGRIVGKAVCEHLCCSDVSHTSDTGPVRNPHDPSRTSGGSSSGSAALVANGDCDMAIGADQGGSILMPSSFCGAYGLKPTHGLVPYTGAVAIERTLDHLGPIALTVSDLAVLLQVLAGPDGFDPRQVANHRTDDYVTGLEDGVKGLRIGLLEEAFGMPGAEHDVDAVVRDAAAHMRELGATVSSVSIPWHLDAVAVWDAIVTDGGFSEFLDLHGGPTNAKGFYDTPLIDAFRSARKASPELLAPTVILMILTGEYIRSRHGTRYYAKAQNLAGALKSAYDNALASCDVLVMPTTRTKAPRLPPEALSLTEYVEHAFAVHEQPCPFDVTGHPAINIPCAVSDGLPIGLMAVGRHWEEATLLRLARACELSLRLPLTLRS